MAKISRQVGTTSQIVEIFIQDMSQTTTVAGLTGLSSASSGLTWYYKRNKASSSTAVTIDASSGVTLGTYEPSNAAHGAIKEVDSTHCPGMYELQLPDNALASGADTVTHYLQGVTNMGANLLEIDLGASVLLAPLQPNAITFAAGVTINNSTTNGAGLAINGNGTGSGIIATGGATGNGISGVGGSSSGAGLGLVSTTGAALGVVATSGSAVVFQSVSGKGFVCIGSGTNNDISLDGSGKLGGTVATVTTLSGTVVLATSQPNYTPATATALAGLITTVGVAGAGLTAIPGLTNPWTIDLATGYSGTEAGNLLLNAGQRADPLLNDVPGNYDPGTAGYALGNLPATANVTISPVVITLQNNQIVAPPIAIFYNSEFNLAFILQDATGNPVIPPSNAVWELVVFSSTPVADLLDTTLFTASGTIAGSTVNVAGPYTDPSQVGQFSYGLWDNFNHKCYGGNRCQIVNAGVP